jgi:cytochrome P450
VPVAVIAELVGVPREDRPRFRAWSTPIVSGGRAGVSATAEFARYIDQLAARRKTCPEDDLVSELVALEGADGGLQRDELIAMVLLLLVAGQETTVDLIANGTLALLAYPDQWRALRDDPELVPAAVEEILRYEGSVEIAPPRFAFSDIEIAGGTIPAFDTVAASTYGANHDPDVFAGPERFDIHRHDVSHHVAFGHGPHFCLGAPLGRLEARIMFERLPAAFPDLAIAIDPSSLQRIDPRVDELPLRT